MLSNNDNSTDLKLGDSVSNSGWGRDEAEKKTEDKESAHELDSDEARKPAKKSGLTSDGGSGHPFNGRGQGNQTQGTNRETGSTRGGLFEHHAEG